MKKQAGAYKMMLLGQQIVVKTTLCPDEMKDLVVLIEDHFNSVKKQASANVPLQKLYLLAMLSIAEKHIALRSRLDSFRNEIADEIGSMKGYIDRYIQQTKSDETLKAST